VRFDGAVLLATGAASGLGAATARRFADEGAQVAVADILI
jgi:NAD(P)-dependent dehydrogenase (short-subunit alcohol dehydrogenase family)